MYINFFLLLLVFALNSTAVLGQKTIKISGLVKNDNQPLVGATAVLLNTVDSSFVSYALTTDIGKFNLEGKKDSAYILHISYLGYASYSERVLLRQDTSWGLIELLEATNELESVEVVAEHIPVQMRGDTLSFNSAAFDVQAHDKVEQLLKQLPGLEVREDGKITVNGIEVTEILVDGRTFLGDNAQAILKNLSADLVKKIDITETKRSKDGLELTQEEKTINLKLKKEAKNKLMGNVGAGYGHVIPPNTGTPFSDKLGNHLYVGNALLFYLSPKVQFSVNTAINNVNESVFITRAGQDPMEVGASRFGMTRTLMGGGSLELFLSEKTSFALSYTYLNSLSINPQSASTLSVLPNNDYTQNSHTFNTRLPQRHLFFSSFKHKFDSTQRVNIYCRVDYQDNVNEKQYNAITKGSDSILENEINQSYQSNNASLRINPRVNFQKNYKKKGRDLIANVILNFRTNPMNSTNYSLTNLYNNNGILTEIDTLEQEQQIARQEQSYRANVLFQEPIGKDQKLSFRAFGELKNSQNDQVVYDVKGEQKQNNSDLSEWYNRHYNHQGLVVSFKRNVKQYRLSIGVGIKRSELKGITASWATPIHQVYYFPTGNAMLRYAFTKTKKLTFRYTASFKEPRLDQLQPIVNNQNPLFIVKGNPDLQPEYQHHLNLRTDFRQPASFSNFYASVGLFLIQNTVVQAQTIDENFRSVTQPMNNSGLTYRLGVYWGYNTLIKALKTKVGLRGGLGLNNRPVMLNGEWAEQLNQNYNANLSLSNQKKKIISASFTAQLVVGNVTYLHNAALNTHYINHSYQAKFRVTLAKQWNIQTEFQYQVYANTGLGETIVVPIWSASIYRNFFKNKQLKVELKAENLLNESLQVARYTRNGLLSENHNFLLGRYLMLKLQYRLPRKK